ncbi:MAG: TRAP transporter substrate-binding protein DctP [Bacillota bacterium]
MLKKILVGFLLLTLVFVLTGCGSEEEAAGDGAAETQEAITWTFAHEEVQGSVQDRYAQKFKEVIEAKTDGAVKIDVYPVGQLGDGANQVELLQNGAIQLGINNPGSVGTLVPETNLFSLHFLLPSDMDKAHELVNNSEAMEMLNQKYLEKNMKVLGWFPEGYQMWTGNKKITEPADFEGFKIRTMASPVISESYKTYGADPTPIPYMEVYSSLQLNMIDGQVNPIFAIEEMKFYEVQDYMMLSNQAIFVGTFIANDLFWDSLSAARKEQVKAAADEATAYILGAQKDLNATRLESIKENSEMEIVELTPAQREKFKEASLPAREFYVEKYGEDAGEILEMLLEDVAKITK